MSRPDLRVAGGGRRLQCRCQGRLRLGCRVERVHDTSIQGLKGLRGLSKMLVPMFNAVKVESVPLNSDKFSQPAASPLTGRRTRALPTASRASSLSTGPVKLRAGDVALRSVVRERSLQQLAVESARRLAADRANVTTKGCIECCQSTRTGRYCGSS